ncbi:Uncharacterised protein [Mycobacterium tuberculosis]|nr:Uncharacterised protein [Mycobacterium tuberculosis]
MCAVAVSAPRPVSSDPKPREGTETHPTRYRWRASFIESSDPKPREGTETFRRQFVDHEFSESSDPKPREGTETRKRRASSDRLLVVRPKTPRGDGNPYRGRRRCERTRRVVRPKTPRGDGNSRRGMARQAWLGGRQTQNPERGRKRVKPPPASPGPPRSSDPKPREGTETLGIPCADSGFACRQTQNPERGRKLHHASCHQSASSSSSDPKPREGTETWDICCPPGEMLSEVVRPKTPRGDGNLKPCCTATRNSCTSSDPKPREGTETRKRSTSLTILFSRRQTQNPERGRKLKTVLHCNPEFLHVVRPKTPRGDGNRMDPGELQMVREVVRPKTPRGDGNPTMASKSAWVTDPGRQTQNPERGRKP